MTTSDDPADTGLRDGELALGLPLPADAALAFIGHIETPWRERSACPRQGDAVAGPACRLHLAPMWMQALDGIDALAELQVLYWMHHARRDLVRLVPKGGTPRGPFALRAPTRPNPIASSVVALLDRRGAVLTVRGLDCLDGTPLLDLKPWRNFGH